MVRLFSFRDTYLFQELRKVMMLPSHQQADIMNISSSSKYVAPSFAAIILDHMNFGSHVNAASESEASISTKSHYFSELCNQLWSNKPTALYNQ